MLKSAQAYRISYFHAAVKRDNSIGSATLNLGSERSYFQGRTLVLLSALIVNRYNTILILYWISKLKLRTFLKNWQRCLILKCQGC